MIQTLPFRPFVNSGGQRAPMDGYCERLGPGLWAEPLNAVSNAAFLIACAALLIQNRQRTLPILLGVVGLCSLGEGLAGGVGARMRWGAVR